MPHKRRFYAVEIDTALPGSDVVTFDLGYGVTPFGALSLVPDPAAAVATRTIRASDLGYRGRVDDVGGIRVFPPWIDGMLAYNRLITIDPAQPGISFSYSPVDLTNFGKWDDLAFRFNAIGRPVAILTGEQTLDPARGNLVDPPYADLAPMFAGVADRWSLTEATLTVPLRGAAFWLDQPLPRTLFGGTGGYDGTDALSGTNMPMARGGTDEAPIPNVTPVLADPVNQIWRFSDGPGSVVALYEAGFAGFAYEGDVADLLTGSTSPGAYRTDNARGAFQLGSVPVGQITCDVTGEFPIAGAVTVAALIVRYLITEEAQLDAAMVDETSFADAATAYPYVAGLYFAPDDAPSAKEAVARALAGWFGVVIEKRDGKLALLVLRAIAAGDAAVKRFDATNIIGDVKEVDLPASVASAPYRFSVGWGHNYTVQTTGLSGSADQGHAQFIANADRWAIWNSPVVRTSYARATDTPKVPSALLVKADAQRSADALGRLFGDNTRLRAIDVPIEDGIACDFGDIVSVAFPVGNLVAGQSGRVVGEQFRSDSALLTLLVLFDTSASRGWRLDIDFRLGTARLI